MADYKAKLDKNKKLTIIPIIETKKNNKGKDHKIIKVPNPMKIKEKLEDLKQDGNRRL